MGRAGAIRGETGTLAAGGVPAGTEGTGEGLAAGGATVIGRLTPAKGAVAGFSGEAGT